jgi:hypothetical protein
MYDFVLNMLKIGKTLIPCAWVLGIVHAQDMHDHPIDELGLAICLGVEGSGFGELVVQRCPEARLECVEEPNVSI